MRKKTEIMTDSTITIYHSRPKAESTNKETSPKGDSKSISLGLCPGSENEKQTQFNDAIRHTKYAIREKNKPNFNYSLWYTFTHFLINSSTHSLIYSQKARTFCRFSQLSDQNTLNSIYNKDLHNFSHQNTLHERSLPAVFVAQKNAKQTQLRYRK